MGEGLVIAGNGPGDPAPVRVAHEAMATGFEFFGHAADPAYARGAALAAFAEIDRLEGLLSRYAEGSDLHRIRSLGEGGWLRVSEETHECLVIALRCAAASGGAFDPCIGDAVDAWRGAAGRAVAPGGPAAEGGRLYVDPAAARVACEGGGVNLDLGAIGKGYALDRVARLLRDDWGLEYFLMHGGGSSLVAFAPPEAAPWRVVLAGDRARRELELRGGALGASGTAVQGGHIVDPRDGAARPEHRRAWVLAGSAAEADALSTAAFLMGPGPIAAMLEAAGGGARAFVETPEGEIREIA